jgi:hypothetical protein
MVSGVVAKAAVLVKHLVVCCHAIVVGASLEIGYHEPEQRDGLPTNESTR